MWVCKKCGKPNTDLIEKCTVCEYKLSLDK